MLPKLVYYPTFFQDKAARPWSFLEVPKTQWEDIIVPIYYSQPAIGHQEQWRRSWLRIASINTWQSVLKSLCVMVLHSIVWIHVEASPGHGNVGPEKQTWQISYKCKSIIWRATPGRGLFRSISPQTSHFVKVSFFILPAPSVYSSQIPSLRIQSFYHTLYCPWLTCTDIAYLL